MRTFRAPRRTIGSSIGRGVVLLATLAGLFAMHGLSEHGAAGHAGMDLRSSDLVVSAMAYGDDHQATGDSPAGTSHTMALRDGGMAMDACLAILLAAGLLWQRRAHGRPVYWLVEPRGWCRAVLARARAPDPPDRFHLSIQRC